jgi:hypothetical protein
MSWQIQETRRRSGLEDMFVVCKSFNKWVTQLSLIIYLAEYWSGKYIVNFIPTELGINTPIASSYSYLTFELLKEKWVFSLLRYSRQDSHLRFCRAHFLMCRCIWTSIKPVESGQDMTWELYFITQLSRLGLTMQLPLLIITSVFFNWGYLGLIVEYRILAQ